MREFIDLINILSRSSAQAVSTEASVNNEKITEFKKYLYVETDVERAFLNVVNERSDKKIIFLCGSSGDGKSEILNRHINRYSVNYLFHLDATHSFKPDQTAIEALNDQFDVYKETNKSLVIGINTGMLFTYSAEGADRHNDIKIAIHKYLENRHECKLSQFINFEDYPKFKYIDTEFRSEFIEELIRRLVKVDSGNPLSEMFEANRNTLDRRIVTNLVLLRLPQVQQVVVNVLLKARLKHDQFLTARGVLDLLYHLIMGDKFIFDNLFESGHNEIVDALSSFDPCIIRTRKLDQFLLERSLKIDEIEYQEFAEVIKTKYQVNDIEPSSWLRLLYLLKDVEIGNNYHKQFIEDFDNSLFEEYGEIWNLHNVYDGTPEQKERLRTFYRKSIIRPVLNFANRLHPCLSKKNKILIGKRDKFYLSAPIAITPDYKSITARTSRGIDAFMLSIRVNKTEMPEFIVNINFLELLSKIASGYRPNVHDKNTVALLESIVDHILKVCNDNDTLYIDGTGIATSIRYDSDEDEIEVVEDN
ncbi:MAG: DNA phosphorothioation-dependent restriction protein DptF [Candidatus Scalindua sp.]|nr:DNA phosphorothioation-dependent restriction protein DptF [Candidatus Scalindua sp.]